MTDFLPDQDVATFAGEVRDFLADNLTAEMRRTMHDTGTVHVPQLHRDMASHGWMATATAGAKGAPVSHAMAALFRELELADAPYHGMSITMIVIGVVDQLGSDELKARVIPQLLAGETIAVLGYSEPGSGSDVFAARTRAVPVDEEHTAWRINGQKMWTTLAQEAGHVLLLTRTDTERPKHLGLTMFLVPLDTPGITIQPIYTIADERTNVVFYDDVEIPDYCRLGEINEGGRVMAAALSVERGVMGGTAMIEPLVKHTAQWANTPGSDGARPSDDPVVLEALARARIDAEVAFLLTQRTAELGASGQSPATAGSIAKHFATMAYQRAAHEFQEVAGVAGVLRHDAHGGLAPVAHGEVERAVRHSAVTTIQGGTTEIQRNHIAQHRLGLPRTKQA
ncbi:MAG TPA: acyl-CoA dehydrogenase family protein [Frankiaceae bacterium]|nr:acyl-CoA dehydrogenase family protein [Frankiaceae bacterium]